MTSNPSTTSDWKQKPSIDRRGALYNTSIFLLVIRGIKQFDLNVIHLNGLVTSHLNTVLSLYFIFEYIEHDLNDITSSLRLSLPQGQFAMGWSISSLCSGLCSSRPRHERPQGKELLLEYRRFPQRLGC